MNEKVIKKPDSIYQNFPRKGGSALTATHYCPGCGHGVVHKIIAEALDDYEIKDRAIMISPVGCSVFAYYYFDCGNVQVAHGRAPAVATGISRARDNAVLLSYQGDGDLASIGLNETMQAANRGEKMAVIFVNNTVYGMTGGQMAPTTLVGEKTITSPTGRDAVDDGHPLHMCELINQLKSPVYIERVSVSDIKHVRKARKAIRKAIEIQKDKKGYAFVEILAGCPTQLRMDTDANTEFMNNELEKEFPLGLFRDNSETAPTIDRAESDFSKEALDNLFAVNEKSGAEIVDSKTFRPYSFKAAGFGGQGVLSLGLAVAQAGCEEGRYVSWYPSYGPEQRGGSSNCSILFSGTPIGSPVVENPDFFVAMNRPAFDRFSDTIAKGGIILYDSSIGAINAPAGVKCISVPAHEIASEAGNALAANTVMLGVFMALGGGGISEESYRKAVRANFVKRPQHIEFNMKLLDKAMEWAKKNT